VSTLPAPSPQASRSPRRQRLRRWLLRLLAAWLLATLLPVLLLRFVDPPLSMVMLADRVAAALAGDEAYRFRHAWLPLHAMGTQIPLAVIAAEDQRFAEHHGFDFVQIADALEERLRSGSSRGASTISQQVAKNLFLWRESGWLRKGLEAWFVLGIEALWPKRRILEVYLNVAEWGPGTFGIGAASQLHFAKPPSRLTRAEAALLAAALPNPRRLTVAQPGAWLRARARWVEGQVRALGGSEYLRRL
jgi:monofunctional biosynthetic peptidoglycan transglycosylase